VVKPMLNDGVTTITLNINTELPEQIRPTVVEHDIPERQGSVLQFLGRASTKFPLAGYTTVQADKNQLRTWAKAGTALTYNDDENTNMSVLIADFEYRRIPGFGAAYYRFSMVIVENT
jgi:hypothetical protein